MHVIRRDLIKIKLSNKLKQTRVAYNFTFVEVATILGINKSTLIRYENDSILPPLDRLEALAKLYNAPLTYLVSDSEDSNSSVLKWIETLPKHELENFYVKVDGLINRRINEENQSRLDEFSKKKELEELNGEVF